jgi:hypothetical protein
MLCMLLLGTMALATRTTGYLGEGLYRDVPIVNPGKRSFWSKSDYVVCSKQETCSSLNQLTWIDVLKGTFTTQTKSLMESARSHYPDKPFRIATDVGEVLALPPNCADELRKHPNLDLSRVMEVVSSI